MSSPESRHPEQTVLGWLTEIFSTELRIEKDALDEETPFQDYGVDSIILVQITRKIDRKLGQPLDPSVLFDCPTLSTLAAYLSRLHAASISRDTRPTQVQAAQESSKAAPKYPAMLSRRPALKRISRRPAASRQRGSDIAVVGMSCRFPGADDLDEYWEELVEGRCAIEPVPERRFKGATPYHAGLVRSIDDFDASFFLIAQEDAKVMDPQGLVVLEEALNLFSHAGYTLDEVKGARTGVYLGARGKNPADNDALQGARNPILAVGHNYLAANVSQFFDLRGPSLVVDTACSSALVAMNLGIKDLLSGEVDAALVGGVSLLTDSGIHDLFQRRKLLSRNNRFHIFDQRASGVILGEGAGLVLLKTLEKAREDGDHVHAVIKSLAINNDGRTLGPAAPSVEAQKEVMRTALEKSGKNPEDIVYVEANGSGSEITDLLELKAIESVYRSASKSPCALGSVKPNIGHPLCAEGIAGFIKLVLMLKHREWVPFLSGTQAMTHYDLKASPFHFYSERTRWAGDFQAVALNCFADGGTNAHLILEGGNELSEGRGQTPRRRPLAPPPLRKVNVRSAMAGTTSKEGSSSISLGEHGLFKPPSPWALRFDNQHPILSNHKAYGQELMPGLAFIDLFYQLFREKGFDYRELELRNLSIYQPLILPRDKAIGLRIVCDQIRKSAAWKIRLESDVPGGASAAGQYVVAEMHSREPAAFAERIELSCLDSSFESYSLGDAYKKCREQELLHTGVMKAEGAIYAIESADLIDLSVTSPSCEEGAHFMFHPALIDGSGVAAGSLHFPGQSSAFRPSTNKNNESRLYLPLHCGSFRASGLLQDKCFVRIKRSSVREKNDLIILNLEFFNVQGEKLAELSDFTSKLVREAGMINPAREGEGRQPGRSASDARSLLESNKGYQQKQAAMRAQPGIARKAEELLSRVLASKLEVPLREVDVNAGYYEMGLTSSMLLGVVGDLEKELSISLTPTLLFEYPSISELSAYLTKTHGEKFREAPSFMISDDATGIVIDDKGADSVASHDRSDAASTPNSVAEDVLEIAVIGLAGRYPGAASIGDFWENLKGGVDSITEIPEERWDWRIFDGLRTPSGKRMSKWGGFIDRPDYFDPQFFRISPREAKVLDPQERLFLEVCWEAIEDAGYTPANLTPPQGPSRRMDVGVFVGVMHKDYTFIGVESLSQGEGIPLSLNYAPIANRVSYSCNFHGPSMAVDTVCSASLTAVHLGIQSLQRRESQVVLVGGVNLSLHPNKYLTYGMWDMHSSDGRCRAFGEGGDGYVSGEGVGAIVLKPLYQAIRDRDHIYAVIKGSTVNHVGKVSGITVPSPVAQSDMIQRCFEQTGIDPRTISYIEAHGTGTSLGDPIEFRGLVSAFRRYTEDKQFCSIGSVKSNIGHAESAAGISGLTKVILQLFHKTLVPSLHSEKTNPLIDLENSPFYIQRKTEAWIPCFAENEGQQKQFPRRAGISSFGATGSNAHVIIEEYTGREYRPAGGAVQGREGMQPTQPTRHAIVPLSARNATSLRIYARRLLGYLQRESEIGSAIAAGGSTTIELDDLAYTLQVGRVPMEERLALVVTSKSELCAKLEAFASGHDVRDNCWTGQAQGVNANTAFLEREDILELLTKWASRGEVDKIAALWAQGFEVDWERVWDLTAVRGERPYRISLPTYPFSRERYWLDALRPRQEATITEDGLHSRANAVVHYTSAWKLSSHPARAANGRHQKGPVDLFIAAGEGSETYRAIASLDLADNIHQLSVSADVPAQVEENTIRLIRYCQELVRNKDFRPRYVIAYVPSAGGDLLYRYLMGTLRTISLEFPFLRTKLIFDSALAAGSVKDIQRNIGVELEAWDSSAEVLYGEDHSRYVLSHELLSSTPGDALSSPFRDGGVYLVTGGLGGLGAIVSRHIGINTGSHLILLGRSPLAGEKASRLSRMRAEGVDANYIVCDATQEVEVQEVVRQVLAQHGRINGVIHSAGELADELIPKKKPESVARVLSAKVRSTLVLDEATKDLDLDFFVSFSSVASFGNIGQIDYATGNSFLDAFSYQRHQLVSRGTRRGKSLSINWPLWREGGMSVDKAQEERLFKKIGMMPLQTATGLDALATALRSEQYQFGVIEGSPDKIRNFLGIQPEPSIQGKKPVLTLVESTQASSTGQQRPSVVSDGVMQDAVLEGLSKILGMDRSSIDARTPLSDYGADSIGLMELAGYLNERFGLNYTGAVFFELDDVAKIVDQLSRDVDGESRALGRAESTDEPVSEDAGVEANEPVTLAPGGVPDREGARLTETPTQSRSGSASMLERVCIIGYDCSLPGADDAEQFWANVCEKVISTRRISKDEWAERGIHFDDSASNQYKSMQWSALLRDVDRFDANFWGIEPELAAQMDPQQRLLLQSIWRCVESSRYSLEKLTKGKVGLYLAVDSIDYKAIARSGATSLEAASTPGGLANQISHYCDFRGPSEAVDNACASVYVSVSKAAQAIALGECDVAVVAGAKILLDPVGFEVRDGGRLLTHSDRMYPFDKRANGYLRAEGLGCFLLKSLRRAEEDGDKIHAVIAGTGVTHNGSKSFSLLSPNVDGQCEAIQNSYRSSGIDPRTVNYIEAHGTGTNFNDAAEIAAFRKFLRGALDADSYREHRCSISTVKGNIGHLEGASGIASLLKVVMALKYKTIPPIATFSQVSPSMLLAESPFDLPTAPVEWVPARPAGANAPDLHQKRRAGLHSVGIGGVNAHMILEEYVGCDWGGAAFETDTGVAEDESRFEIVTISARSRRSLALYCEKWLRHMTVAAEERSRVPGRYPEISLKNIAYSSRSTRVPMPHRIAFVVDTLQVFIGCLEQTVRGSTERDLTKSHLARSGEITATRKGRDEVDTSCGRVLDLAGMRALADAWVGGRHVDWENVARTKGCVRVDLPTYSFENQKCWIEGSSPRPKPVESFEALFEETFGER